jgi:hypothetical protein
VNIYAFAKPASRHSSKGSLLLPRRKSSVKSAVGMPSRVAPAETHARHSYHRSSELPDYTGSRNQLSFSAWHNHYPSEPKAAASVQRATSLKTSATSGIEAASKLAPNKNYSSSSMDRRMPLSSLQPSSVGNLDYKKSHVGGMASHRRLRSAENDSENADFMPMARAPSPLRPIAETSPSLNVPYHVRERSVGECITATISDNYQSVTTAPSHKLGVHISTYSSTATKCHQSSRSVVTSSRFPSAQPSVAAAGLTRSKPRLACSQESPPSKDSSKDRAQTYWRLNVPSSEQDDSGEKGMASSTLHRQPTATLQRRIKAYCEAANLQEPSAPTSASKVASEYASRTIQRH